MPSYAIQLAQDLVRCPSVTPAEGGALDLMQDELSKLGFDCTRLPFGTGVARIDNLFARRGISGPHFAFAGHTDVVPVGDPENGSMIHLAVFCVMGNCLAVELQT